MRRATIALTLGLLMAGTGTVAQDYVVSEGRLSDTDFYNLVSCGAPPGKPCRDPHIRWAPEQARALAVGIHPPDSGYPERLWRQLDHGLDLAIGALNAVGAALHIVRTDAGDGDITLHLVNAREGEAIYGTGNDEMDGVIIGAGLVHVRWNGDMAITQGTIALAADIPLSDAYPVLLEELTQSLGLLTDIKNPYYEDLSVFSEDSNSVTKLAPQDRMALLRHYPVATTQ
ncbi:MAG: hypothetical protein P8N72_14515 [Flavimaricola sp.]|nr:hypothetical protein [Flavimaricola sp.]